jgi:hypothetical protein
MTLYDLDVEPTPEHGNVGTMILDFQPLEL